jgi:FtsP/CotA-like multicopper oxidase with cupredoxin domain
MGRFGNRLLIAGDPDLRLSFPAGEVVRLWLTNTANTRVFNVTLPGAQMKLVGGDSGRVEYEEFVKQVVLAPSERAVLDVLLESRGELALEHHTPSRSYRLAAITAAEGAPSTTATRFRRLRRAPELDAELAKLDRWLAAAPDKILALVADGRPSCNARGRRAGHLRLSNASGRHERRARPLSQVRHETARQPGPHGDRLRMPDASGGGQRSAGSLPKVRHEAARGKLGAYRDD